MRATLNRLCQSALLLITVVISSTAFVQLTPPSSTRYAVMMSTGSGSEKPTTRAEAFQHSTALGSGLLAGALLVPRVGMAVEEEKRGKDEVEQFRELRGALEKEEKKEQAKESLSQLIDAAAGLKALDSYIGEKDYQSLRVAMRRPPIVYLRASARKVIISMDNEAEAKRTQAAYSALITSVDKLDGIASRGMREKGGLKDDTELLEVYGKCVERGSALLDLLPKSG